MMNSVPQNRLAESASINNILQQVGASLGVAFLGALLSHRTTFHTAVAGQSIKATDPAFLSVIGNVMDHVHGFGFSHGQAYAISKGMVTQAVIRSAVIKSYQDTFFVGGIVVLLSIPFALFLPWGLVRRKHGHTLDREEIEELPVEVIID
jgi:DHA2 family multidrug resistance protein